jgi:hypothetical protein
MNQIPLLVKINITSKLLKNNCVEQLVSNSREFGLNENGFVFGKFVIIRKIGCT